MSWNPQPALGGALWNGNQTLATTRQLISTTTGLMDTTGYTPLISTFSTLLAEIIFADGISTLRLSTGSFTTGVFNTNSISTLLLSTGSFTTGAFNTDSISTLRLSTGSFTTGVFNTDSISTLRLSTGSLMAGSLTAGTATLSGTLNMNNNNITNVNTIGATNGNFTNLGAATANITSLNGGTSGVNGTFADLTVNNNARFNNNVTDFTHKTLSNVDTIHSGSNSALVGCNLNLRATNALLGYGGNIEFEANQGSLVAAEAVVTLKAKNGNRGKISLEAEPGYAGIQGEINLTATGGTPPSATSLGGRIHLSATTPNPITSISPSYVLQTADSILAYAGGLSPIAGNYGYNYQQGLNGVNIVAGTVATIPNVLGTVYLYGTNAAGTGNSGGVRIQNGLSVDVIFPYPTAFITPDKDLILKGNSAGNKVSLSNVRNIQSDGGDVTGFYTIFGSNIDSQVLRTRTFTTSNRGYISSLSVDELIGGTTSASFYDSVSTNKLSSGIAFINAATINKITLPPTSAFSIEQRFVSTSAETFSALSNATNYILSTSIQLTTTSLPEINLINNQVFNNTNIGYWASTIVIAQTTDQTVLSNTLAGISPNTGRLVYRNSSGVPLVIYAPYNGGTTGIVVPQNSNWGFTYNGSYWDINQTPDNVGGTYGTSFSMFQNYNNTTFKTPDIITLDSAVVNVTGTLGNTAITTANITQATINQLNSSNITLANTPSYSIEQSFISTTGTPFVNISNATNYILSTSISLTATTLATNPIIPNLNIGNTNVDYWASTIQVATDFGATPTIFNSLLPLTGGLTGQITYSNASLTKTITINQFPNLINIPPGSNYQFTWDGTTWLLNQNPTNTTGTSGTSFSLFQNYNNTTLKTPDLLTLDCAAMNVTGLINGINIGTATIQEATANQITTNNITMTNSPDFSIKQTLFSTTSQTFNAISSAKNLILSTTTEFIASSQEQQPFVDNFRVGTQNTGTWMSTIFAGPDFTGGINTLEDIRLQTVFNTAIVYYRTRGSPVQIQTLGPGGNLYTIPANNTYSYTYNRAIQETIVWTQNTSVPSLTSRFGTSFSIEQNYFDTRFTSPDTISLNSPIINLNGVVNANQLNTSNLELSNITASNITATNATITNLNTVTENTRTMTYSTITGNLVQGTIGINQNTNYTTIGRTINLASNLQYSVFPNISSIASQNVFNNTINYNKYPGGFFQLMPSGSVGGQVLFDNGTITSPNPLTGVSWFSSIMGITAAPPGPTYYPFTIPPSTRGEFILQGTRDPVGYYQINIGAGGAQIAINFNEYHRWTNLTGASWSSNLTSATIYPTTNTTETASLVMQPGGLLNINAQYLGFANSLRVVSYCERQNGSLQLVSGFGKAQIDNIQVQFQGKKFSSSDYNCTISFTNYGASQPSLATNQVAVNTYPDAQGNWMFQLRLTTATIPGVNTACFWEYQVLLTPRVFATGTNSAASFNDPDPWEAINAPGLHVSSMTASTMSVYSSENILLNAAVPFEAVIGVGNIGLNASTNVNLMANYDINLDAFQNMYLTATSSIQMSNVAGSAFMGLDEIGTTVLFGSNVVMVANSNVLLSSSNVITIESLSTINTTSYNYYQASSNLTELHNENYSNTSRTSAHHITNNFIVSTCLNSYYIKNVRQPFIQYGETTGSNNTGNRQVILPVPYSSINAYKAFVTMEDSNPAEMSAVRNSSSTFTIYWQQAANGTHTIAWNTMGNVECGGGAPPPPSEPAAYDLVNYIFGDTAYFTWSQDGTPDYEQVYTLQSVDDGEYSIYTTNTVFTPELTLYTLAQGYWYKFYISSHYGDSPRVESSNSSSVYVNYI